MITNKHLYIGLIVLLAAAGCRKVQYNTIANPAYLRVFNSLNYALTLANKDNPPPFLAMVIDPVFNSSGVVINGLVIGDYLDERLPYAPPYPTNAGSTDSLNNEYPGTNKVLVGPVVNGFDLSSWAQIPSGKHRIQFYSRTKSTVPFLQLPANARQTLLVDSTVTLTNGEVYTMEVLQKDVTSTTNIATLYLRDEQFTKLSLADSLTYVNFYNLSAVGYAAEYSLGSPFESNNSNDVNNGEVLQDTMNVFYTLYTPDSTNSAFVGKNVVNGYLDLPLTTIVRSFDPAIRTYYPIPVFPPNDTTGGIYSSVWQQFIFMLPGYSPLANPYGFNSYYGNYATLNCSESNNGTILGGVPNLNVLTPSGPYPERSFSTVSSIEWINNQVYLMSVQRQYPAPINN